LKYKISIIPGDGIGPELTETAMEVLESLEKKLNLNLQYIWLEAGDACYDKRGIALPKETVNAIKNSHACLKGPVGETAADVIVKLRLMFDLYSNIRPIKSYPNVPNSRENINLVFVRENTEGLYRGFEFMIEDTAIGLRVISKKGCERIAKKAFEIAKERNLKKTVTAIHKSNVLKKTCGLFSKICSEVSKDYPDIEYNEQYVDAASMRLIKAPENYDVIVTTNMFGDILSDEAAQLIGGLGMAPGANIGDNFALFEPIHGSAPTRVGKHTANPISMILAVKMMFDWLGGTYNDVGYMQAANYIQKGIEMVLLKNLTVPDLGGKLKTIEMGKAIAKEILFL
jgi:3-isopropylmalate dehydrogenase